MNRVDKFYTTRAWRTLSTNLKIQKGLTCSQCGKVVIDGKQLIGHHKIHLTEENVTDPQISLNPDNIEIICLDCHNKLHHRFGSTKQVFIVYGAPLSGKSSLVKAKSLWNDIILDIDSLWQAVSGLDRYKKPELIRFNIFALRDNLLDQIKTRYGKWDNAYIIGGYANKYERERVAAELGAELIYCDSSKEECLLRRKDNDRPVEWDKYIEEWFEEFERTKGE